MDRGRHGVRVQVAGPGNDRGHARADVVALDDGCMPDFDAAHVGDGVQLTRWEYADDEADVTRPRTLVRMCKCGKERE